MIEETYLKHNRNDDTVQVAYICDIDSYEILHSFVDSIYNIDEDEDYDVFGEYEDEDEDMVNHPSHYTKYGIECIHEMIILYGRVETMSFCKLNAHKYRKRAMDKGGRQDMDKSDFYVKMYANLSTMTDQEAIDWVMSLYKDYLAA